MFNHIEELLKHIEHVREHTKILSEKLYNKGEEELAKVLIVRGLVHDKSKFFGIEWKGMNQDEDKDLLYEAVDHHRRTNSHHPEYHPCIQEMPRIDLAEFCCDTYARSYEFGTDLWTWINEEATKKYKFNSKEKVYKDIKYFTSLLLNKPFKKL